MVVLVDGQEVEIPGGFQCLIPRPGMRIEVPTFFEINARTTLKWCEDVDSGEWEYIARGPLFPFLFAKICDLPVPATKEELLAKGFDVQHLAGLICLCVEYGWGNPNLGRPPQNIFLRTPEDLLHPRQTYHMMTLLETLFPHSVRRVMSSLGAGSEPASSEQTPESEGAPESGKTPETDVQSGSED